MNFFALLALQAIISASALAGDSALARLAYYHVSHDPKKILSDEAKSAVRALADTMPEEIKNRDVVEGWIRQAKDRAALVGILGQFFRRASPGLKDQEKFEAARDLLDSLFDDANFELSPDDAKNLKEALTGVSVAELRRLAVLFGPYAKVFQKLAERAPRVFWLLASGGLGFPQFREDSVVRVDKYAEVASNEVVITVDSLEQPVSITIDASGYGMFSWGLKARSLPLNPVSDELPEAMPSPSAQPASISPDAKSGSVQVTLGHAERQGLREVLILEQKNFYFPGPLDPWLVLKGASLPANVGVRISQIPRTLKAWELLRLAASDQKLKDLTFKAGEDLPDSVVDAASDSNTQAIAIVAAIYDIVLGSRYPINVSY